MIACLIENVAFSSVGIFCASSLSVFCDDAAQLMFAHYGDSLKGLALIYEAHKLGFNKVEYTAPTLMKETDTENRWEKWVLGEYSNMKGFMKNSLNWEYEHEYRLFDKPDICKAEKHGIVLKAIFYTPRLDRDHISLLTTFNSFHYNNRLEIKEISPHGTKFKFVIRDKSSSSGCIPIWICENIK